MYLINVGLALEELTNIFQGHNRVKRSVAKTEVVVHDGHITEVLDKEQTA